MRRAKTVVETTYSAIRRELYHEGECVCVISGAKYRFLYTGFGAEVTRNEEYLCELSHDWEIAEILDELAISI